MYSPASLACGPHAVNMQQIDAIAIRVTKEIRHMDRIDYDPEGQRILKLLVPALREAYRLAIPEDDGKTTSVTTAEEVAFKVSGRAEQQEPTATFEASTPFAGRCEACKVPHDPRKHYDHAAVPPRR